MSRLIRYLTIFLLIMALNRVVATAAEPCRFQCALDLQFGVGLKQSGNGRVTKPGDHAMGSVIRHISCLYNINKKFSTGIGIGLDYYNFAPNSVPVFATFRHHPLQKSWLTNFYYYTNLGYGLGIGKHDADAPGCMWDLGIGWQKNFRKHFGLNFQIGYSLREFRTKNYYITDNICEELTHRYSLVRNSLTFGIGIVI